MRADDRGYGDWRFAASAPAGEHIVSVCARTADRAVTGTSVSEVTVSGSGGSDFFEENSWILGLGGFILVIVLAIGVFLLSAIMWGLLLRLLFGGVRRALLSTVALGGVIYLMVTGVIPFSWSGAVDFVNSYWGKNLPVTGLFILIGAGPIGLIFLLFSGGGSGGGSGGSGGGGQPDWQRAELMAAIDRNKER